MARMNWFINLPRTIEGHHCGITEKHQWKRLNRACPMPAIGFTGHETTAVFQKNYMRLNVELLKRGPAAQRDTFHAES